MRHFLAQFGPALKWPWTKLMDVPDLDDALVETIAAQSDAQAEGRSIRALERIRDDNLVAILQALKTTGWGAGATLAAYEKRLYRAAQIDRSVEDLTQPIETAAAIVPGDWTDYNGHMNESRYGQMFSDAADGTMAAVGADQAYVAAGHSYFTVEIHISYLEEARAGDKLRVATQVLETAGKRLHLFHWLRHEDGRLLATGEQMLIHVSLETRRACSPLPDLAERLAEIAEAMPVCRGPRGPGGPWASGAEAMDDRRAGRSFLIALVGWVVAVAVCALTMGVLAWLDGPSDFVREPFLTGAAYAALIAAIPALVLVVVFWAVYLRTGRVSLLWIGLAGAAAPFVVLFALFGSAGAVAALPGALGALAGGAVARGLLARAGVLGETERSVR